MFFTVNIFTVASKLCMFKQCHLYKEVTIFSTLFTTVPFFLQPKYLSILHTLRQVKLLIALACDMSLSVALLAMFPHNLPPAVTVVTNRLHRLELPTYRHKTSSTTGIAALCLVSFVCSLAVTARANNFSLVTDFKIFQATYTVFKRNLV
jgi:hypothetical protein